MRTEHRLRLKTLLMILIMVICANAGDLMLKHGMTQIGAVPFTTVGLQHAFLLTITNETIWLAIVFLIGFTVSYMLLMSWADYSYVMPAGAFGYALLTCDPISLVTPASALTPYVFGTLAAKYILNEQISPARWAGVTLVCAGVALVAIG